jgi:23S rRNA (adenine2503-C2)-methyltransferase
VTQISKISVFGLAGDELQTMLAGWGWPRFRAAQVKDWLYNKLVADPLAMSNLSRVDRTRFAETFDFTAGKVAAHQVSTDGTQKLLLKWQDGATSETVMIPEAARRTACVSSQVGCPVGCKFCASGIGGLQRSLTAAQIVEQVFALNLVLLPKAERISNIVFMGMGEPLANYANVMKAIRVLHDPEGFNIGARKITVSTVGVPARMRQLAEEELPLNLAISLHAPNETLRRQLIPWAEHFALSEILDAARYYFDQTGREVTLEYILLAGVNDQPAHARELARLCKSLRANVNLIRYNPVAELGFGRPDGQACVNFQSILRNEGIKAHARKSRGSDIDAACGQLRRKEGRAATEGTEGAERVGMEATPVVELGAG